MKAKARAEIERTDWPKAGRPRKDPAQTAAEKLESEQAAKREAEGRLTPLEAAAKARVSPQRGVRYSPEDLERKRRARTEFFCEGDPPMKPAPTKFGKGSRGDCKRVADRFLRGGL